MHARNHHILGDLVKTGRDILVQGSPFGCVNRSAFKGGIDFRTRHGYRCGSHALGDFKPCACRSNFQAFQVSHGLYSLVGVQERFSGTDEQRHRHHAELLHSKVAPHLQPAAFI